MTAITHNDPCSIANGRNDSAFDNKKYYGKYIQTSIAEKIRLEENLHINTSSCLSHFTHKFLNNNADDRTILTNSVRNK